MSTADTTTEAVANTRPSSADAQTAKAFDGMRPI